MVDEHLVAKAHFANRPDGLGVVHAVPNGLLFALELVDRVGIWVGFCQKVSHDGRTMRTGFCGSLRTNNRVLTEHYSRSSSKRKARNGGSDKVRRAHWPKAC